MSIFENLIRQDKPQDPKRLVLLANGATLITGFLALVVPSARWIWQHGDLGQGAGWALLTLAGGLAGHSIFTFKKPDDPCPPQEDK